MASCEPEQLQTELRPSDGLSANLDLGSGGDGSGRLDPLLSAEASATRNTYLAGLPATPTTQDYANSGLAEFVYDVEYFANHDNWMAPTVDRHYMHFVEFAYPLSTSQPGAVELTSLRGKIASDIAYVLDTIGLDSVHSRMDVVNVSASADGSQIQALVGVGVNLDPCSVPGSCPHWLEEEHVLMEADDPTGGSTTSMCVLPDADYFGATTNGFFCSLTGTDPDRGALDYARTFVNRATITPSGFVPAPCNPVDPAIYSAAGNTGPGSNFTTGYAQSGDRDRSGLPDLNATCYGQEGLYHFSPHNSACNGSSAFCIPKAEALYLMQGGISTAISEVQRGDWSGPAGQKFVCLQEYDITFLSCGGCSQTYESYVYILWSTN